MGTKIEWSDETWNPLVGCEHVSPGCDGCYAARRYVDAHPAAVVVAWREETSVVAVVHPSQIIG